MEQAIHIKILRVLNENMAVVQILPTHACVQLRFVQPIPLQHMAAAREVTPFQPVLATVTLGELTSRDSLFAGCKLLQAEWPVLQRRTRKLWF